MPAAAPGICNPPHNVFYSKGIAENKNENAVKQVLYIFARTPAAAPGICNPPQTSLYSLNSKGIAENKNKNAATQVFFFCKDARDSVGNLQSNKKRLQSQPFFHFMYSSTNRQRNNPDKSHYKQAFHNKYHTAFHGPHQTP